MNLLAASFIAAACLILLALAVGVLTLLLVKGWDWWGERP